MSDKGNFPAFSANTFFSIPQDVPPPPLPAVPMLSLTFPFSAFPSFLPSFLGAFSFSLTLIAALCPQKCHPASAGRACDSVGSLSVLRGRRCISSKRTATLCSAVTSRGEAEPHAFSIACKTQSNHPPTLKRQRGRGGGGRAGRRQGSLYKERVKPKAAWQLATGLLTSTHPPRK